MVTPSMDVVSCFDSLIPDIHSTYFLVDLSVYKKLHLNVKSINEFDLVYLVIHI
jgi:hypothetical protein